MPANKREKSDRQQPDTRTDNQGGDTGGSAVVEILEPRTLFSADLIGIGYIDDQTRELDDHPPAPGHLTPSALELVIVDPAVANRQQLLDDFTTQREAGRNLQIYLLDQSADGVEQLSVILGKYENVSAVHLFSHGSNAGLQLGDSWLNLQKVEALQPAMAQWQMALADDADFLIYGCDLAAHDDGIALLQLWADATASNVAASTDTTGHSSLGGDWALEHTIGAVDTSIALSDRAQDDWLNELAVFEPLAVTTFLDVEDGDTSGIQELLDDPGPDGKISLREAIEAADKEDGHNEIYLPDGRYQRSDDGELSIDSDITLRGQSQDGTIIDGESKSRVIHIPGDHTVVFENLQLVNGYHNSKGGAIDAHANSDITFTNVTLTGNTSDDRGGAVLSDGGTVRFNNVVAHGNTAAEGGAVELKGATFTAINSTFYNNTATTKGGAVSGEEAIQTYTNVTLYGNGSAQAGAISTVGSGALLTLNNSTLSGNSATDDGGAIRASQPVIINSSTIAFNSAGTDGSGAGGGLHLSGSGAVDMSNSILEDNTAAASNTGNVKGGSKVTSQGYNIDSDGSAALSGTGDISNTSAMLLPLAAGNTGLLTHALEAGSPAINAGDSATAQTRDANDLLRSSLPDIGASEASSSAIVGTPASINIDGRRDVAWESKPESQITRLSYSVDTVNGSDDLSASWQSTWNSDYLYLFIDVRDSINISGESTAANLFEDDSVEIFLDPDYSRGNTYDGVNDVQLLISRDSATAIAAGPNSAAIDTSQVITAINESGDSYTVEVAVPWSELGISPTADQAIGVDISVNDDDDGAGRESRIDWADSYNQSSAHPDLFGTAELLAVVDNEAPNFLHSGLNLNTDGGNNQYIEIDGGITKDLAQLTFELTFSTTQTGTIASFPLPGLIQPLNIGVDSSLADGELHTLSITWDSSTGEINTYYDGLLTGVVNAGITGIPMPQSSQIVIGQGYDGATFDPAQSFSGSLLDVRVWDTVRTVPQISHALGHQLDSNNAPADLLLNWQMRGLQGAGGDTVVNAIDPGNADLKLTSIATSAQWSASSANALLQVQEHSPNGTAIGYIYPTDPETEANNFSFTLTDDASGRFTIDGSTGLLSVADSANIDFEDSTKHNVTVQVTDDTGDTYEQTFEVDLDALNETPILQYAGGETTIYILGQPAVALDSNIMADDPELTAADNYDGATLTIARQGGAQSEDEFSALGDLADLIGGSTLTLSGTGTVGSVLSNSGGELVIQFNANATQAAVAKVMQSIGYRNTGTYLTPANLPIELTFNDQNDGSQGATGALSASEVVDIRVTQDLLNAVDDDLGTHLSGSTLTVTESELIGNDVSAFEDIPSITHVQSPSTGSLTDHADGTYTFQSAAGTSGDATFVYDIETPDTRIHPDTQNLWALETSADDGVGTSDGTLHGAVVTPDGIQFDGLDDYIELPSITYPDNYSISIDFRVVGTPAETGFEPLFADAISVTDGITVTLASQVSGGVATMSVATWVRDANDGIYAGSYEDITTFIADGNWHRYTLTIEKGVGHKVYIDGDLISSSSRGADAIISSPTPFIGRNSVLTDRLDSSIVSVRNLQIFDSTLPQEDTGIPDPITSSATATITLRNEESLAANWTQPANEGQLTTISNSFLETTDNDPADTATQLLYTLISSPAQGDLSLLGTVLESGNTFTQADINSGHLQYLHDGSESPTNDSFDFSVDDGLGSTTNATFDLTIVPVNDSPTTINNQTLTVSEGSTTVINATSLLITDEDDNATELFYSITTPPVYGHLAFQGAPETPITAFNQDFVDQGRIVYRHHGGSDSTDSFDFSVADSGEPPATPATGTFNISVSTVNDAPVFENIAGDNTLLNSPTYTVGSLPIVIDPAVEVFDEDLLASDNYNGTQVVLSRAGTPNSNDSFAASGALAAITESGALTYGGTTIGTVTTNSGGTLVLDFNSAATRTLVNSTLQSLTYANTADAQSGDITLQWQISDSTETTLGTTLVNLLRVPTLTITTPGPLTTGEDSDVVLSGSNAVSTSDDILQDTPLQIQLQTNSGSLTLNSSNGLTVVQSDSTATVLEGLHSDIASALTNGIVYTPVADYVGSDSLDITLAFDAGLQGQYRFDGTAEDSSAGTAHHATLTGSYYTDPDRQTVSQLSAPGEYVEVTGTFGNPGNLTLAGWVNLAASDTNGAELISLGNSVALRLDQTVGGVTGLFNDGSAWRETTTNRFLQGTGWHHVVYTINSDNARQAIYLDGVQVAQTTYTPSPEYHISENTRFGSSAGTAVNVDLQGMLDDIRIYDRPLTEPEVAAIYTGNTSVDDQIALTITPVNDSPTFSGITTTAINAIEDIASAVDLSSLSIDDVDANGANLQLTVSSNNAIDTLSAANISGLSVTGQNSDSLVLTGTVASLNGWLGNSGSLYFTGPANANGSAASQLSIQISDLGNTGAGAANVINLPPIPIDIVAVNDPPTGSDNTIEINEDQAYTLRTADFGFADDLDAGINALSAVMITSLPTNGLLTASGSNVAAGDSIPVTALDNNNVVFHPNINEFGASYATLMFQVIDDGGTTNGGVNTDATPRSLIFNVAPLNDAPAGQDNTIAIDEDSVHTFSTSDFGYSDPSDGDNLQSVRIDTLPARGQLLLNGTSVTESQVILAAQISSSQLTFAPALDANGSSYDSFGFSVIDDGANSTGVGASDTTSRDITFDVTAINDAPVVLARQISIDEADLDTVISSAALYTSDVDNSASAISYTVTDQPQFGFLALDSNPGELVTSFTQEDIHTGNLHYRANGHGAVDDSFAFRVSDLESVLSAPHEFTITVAQTNDEPSFEATTGYAVLEIPSMDVLVRDAVTQPDGKTIVTGTTGAGSPANFDTIVARFNADGTPDTTFGTGGIATFDIYGTHDDSIELAILSDGKIVAAGSSFHPTSGYAVTVHQLNRDGTPDNGFNGTGRGIYFLHSPAHDWTWRLTTQGDDKIVIAGATDMEATTNHELGVLRINTNGTPDSSLAGGGLVAYDHNGGLNRASGLGLQSDNAIIVSLRDSSEVLRFAADGTFDGAFGTGGSANVPLVAQNLLMQSDDGIVVAGNLNDNAALYRLLPSGAVDSAFGVGGLVETDFGGIERFYDIKLQSDGKILIGGRQEIGSDNYGIVARYNANGTLDTSFGNNGFTLSHHAVSLDSNFFQLTVSPDDSFRMVLQREVGGNHTTELHSFKPNGNPDYRFNPATISDTLGSTTSITEGDPAIVLDDDVRIFDHELSQHNDFGDTTLTVARSTGANTVDVFTANGLLGPLIEGQNLTYDGTVTGSVIQNSAGSLLLAFDAGTGEAIVSGVMQSIGYQNTSQDPESLVSLQWTFSDGNDDDSQGVGGALIATGYTHLSVTPINQAPTIIDHELTMINGAIDHPLTPANLHTADVDNTDDELSYTLNAITSHITLQLGTNPLAVGDTFTQQDVIDGNVTVDHNGDASANASFDVTVNDGDLTHTATVALTIENNTPHDLAPGISINRDGGNDNYLLDTSGYNYVNGLSSISLEFSFSGLTPNTTGFSTLYSAVDNSGHNEYLAIHPDGQVEWHNTAIQSQGVLSGTDFIDPALSFPNLFDGERHSISITLDTAGGTDSLRLYIDGDLANTASLPLSSSTIIGDLSWVIGQQQSAELVFDPANALSGTLHDVRVWDHVRTHDEINDNRLARFDNDDLPIGLHINWQMESLNGDNTVINHSGLTGANALPVTLALQHATGAGFTRSTAVDNLQIADNASAGALIGIITARDLTPDAGGYSYLLDDDKGGLFSIDASSGAIRVQDASLLNATEQSQHDLVVIVSGSETPTRSYSQTVPVTLLAVNEQPVIIPGAGTLSATEQIVSDPIDAAITITDEELDTTDYAGSTLTLQRAGGANTDDEFHAASSLTELLTGAPIEITGVQIGEVTVNDSGTLTLTFNANATGTLVNQVARLIAYRNASDSPPAYVSVQWTFDDGNTGVQGSGGAHSADASTLVTLASVNDAPSIDSLLQSATYTENASPVILSNGVQIIDPDLQVDSYAGASVRIERTGGANMEDVFSHSGLLGPLIEGDAFSYNGSTAGSVFANSSGTLQLQFDAITGSAVNEILRALTYQNISENPPSQITLDWMFNDGNTGAQGSGPSLSVDQQQIVPITPINDAPVITHIDSASLTFTEGDGAMDVLQNLQIDDDDEINLQSAAVSITSGYEMGEDELIFGNTASIFGSWDATSGTLTLTGEASHADYASALHSVQYVNHNTDNPATVSREITVVVSDSVDTSAPATRTINLLAENDAPTLADSDTSIRTYTENQPSLAIVPGLAIADVDGNTITGATISIDSSYQPGEDLLLFTDTDSISATWDGLNGILTLTGNASVLEYQSALQSISYFNSSEHPDPSTRSLTLTVSDGIDDSNQLIIELRPVAINDAPELNLTTTDFVYRESDAATLIAADLTLSDVDSTDLTQATISIENNYHPAEDLLSFINSDNITADWDADTGSLTLQGSAPIAEYQSALRAVTYTNTNNDNPTADDRRLAITVHDGTDYSATRFLTLAIEPVNDAPVLTLTSDPDLVFTENDAALHPITSATLTDADNSTIESATIQISGNYADGQDSLTFADTDQITGLWDSNTGTLLLSGSATLDAYRDALQAVQYSNASDNPTAGTRTLSYAVHDGIAQSSSATLAFSVLAVNDPPSAANNTIRLAEDTPYVFDSTDFGFADPQDNHNLLAIYIDRAPARGQLLLGEFLVTNGETIDVADIDNGLLTFAPVAQEFGEDYADFIFRVVDDGGSANGGADLSQQGYTINLNVDSVDDAPTAIVPIGDSHLHVAENSVPGTIVGRLSSIDPDPAVDAIADGGFNATPTPNADANTLFAGEMAGSWLITTGSIEVRGTDWQASPNGGKPLDLNGLEPGSIEQSFTTVPGGQYELSFALAGNFRGGANDTVSMQIDRGAETVALQVQHQDGWSKDNLGWQQQTVSFTATANTTTIALSSTTPGMFGAIVSDLSLITSHRYELAENQDDTFAVTANGLLVVGDTPPDYEASDTLQVEVRSIGTDGLAYTDTIDVEIEDLNESPSALMSTPLVVEDGLSSVITAEHLQATDPDRADSSSDDLFFTIEALPVHGTLFLDGNELSTGQTFSQAAIDGNQLRYTHAGGYTPNDSIALLLADGGEDNAAAVSIVLPIVVDHVNESPVLQAVDNLSLLEGATLTLTSGHLNATDGDSNPTQLYYTITSAPEHGRLYSNEDPSSDLVQFTQQDILDGKIHYEHDDGNAPVDTLAYSLYDLLDDDGAVASSGTIQFNIIDIADAPVGTDNQLHTLEHSPITLSVADFGFDDQGDGNRFISTQITALPAAGTLLIQGEPVFQNQHISTIAIERGELMYQPAEDATVDDVVSLTFRVSDDGSIANNGQTVALSTNTLTIHVGDSAPPVAIHDSIAAVQRGSISSLASGASSVLDNDRDSDTEQSLLKAVIVDSVQHGSLELFTDGTFRYIHDGSDNFDDSFSYRIIDGNRNDDTSVSNVGFVEIAIEPLPPAPTAGTLPDHFIATYDQLNIPLPENLFQSNAENNALTYSATLANGEPLPDWLTFDPVTGLLSGKPGINDIGELDIEVTALDINDKSSSSVFRLMIEPSLDPALEAPVTSQQTPVADSTPSVAPAITQTATEQPQSAPTESPDKPELERSSQITDTEPLFAAASTLDSERATDTFVDTVVKNDAVNKNTETQNVLVQSQADPIFTVSLDRLFFSSDETTLKSAKSLIEKLDREREAEQDQALRENQVVASAITVSTGLSIGYIVWLVRGGLLVGSVLSSMPAWRWIDPLPVLSNLDDSLEEDEESLQSMVEKNARPGSDQHSATQPPEPGKARD